MENIELKKIWQGFDNENKKSKKELDLILKSKIKKTFNKFIIIIVVSILISLVVLSWIITTSILRQNDNWYLIINVSLGFATILSIFFGFKAWFKLKHKTLNISLKKCLDYKINTLSPWLTGRYKYIYFVTIPILYTLILLSIHVFLENKLFVDILKSEESITGLLVGSVVGILFSYYTAIKIRKVQLNNLNFLKELYKSL